MSFGVANQGGTELITSINAALDSSAVLTSLSSVVSSRIATRGPRGRGKRGFTRFGLGEFDVFDSLEIEGVTGYAKDGRLSNESVLPSVWWTVTHCRIPQRVGRERQLDGRVREEQLIERRVPLTENDHVREAWTWSGAKKRFGERTDSVVRLSACQLATEATRPVAMERVLEDLDEPEFLRPRIPRPCDTTLLLLLILLLGGNRSGFRAGLGGETERDSDIVWKPVAVHSSVNVRVRVLGGPQPD